MNDYALFCMFSHVLMLEYQDVQYIIVHHTFHIFPCICQSYLWFWLP